MVSKLAIRIVLISAVAAGSAIAQRRPVTVGVPFTVLTPESETLELALDELELDWSEFGAAGRPFAAQPISISGVVLIEQAPTRAVFRVSGAVTPEDLAAISRAMEGANPASEANFVLYAPASGRDAGSRRVLTTHLAFVLDDPSDPTGAVEALSAQNPLPLEGVQGGFVIEASDPLNAIQLSDQIRTRAGVKSAYPLVKRRQFVR